MLLAEALALVAIDPESGRPTAGNRPVLNACLAGLLLAEVSLPDRPPSPLLDAAAAVVAEAGPKPKAVLSAMDRSLRRRLGRGTWDAVVDGLVVQGVVGPATGSRWPRHQVLDRPARDDVVDRLRAAAAGDEPLDPRTAVLLSMTGPAELLEVVAPDRKTRRHARRRIDHALDATALLPVAESVRRVLAEANAAVLAVTVAAASTAAVTGS